MTRTSNAPQLIHGFFSQQDIATLRIPRRWHASVIDADDSTCESSVRTSSQVQLRDVKLINLLSSRLAQHCVRGVFEEGSWVKYEIGEKFDTHGDAAGLDSGRMWTLLLCISAAARGGETRFPHLSQTYLLKPGDALVWCNYSGGLENELMDHAALPVLQGTKIVINAWFASEQVATTCQPVLPRPGRRR